MAALVLVAPSAGAQVFPAKAVTLVVPFAPGGITDLIGRVMAGRLSEKWKHPVVVDNRGGGGTIIGTTLVANAPADGHTLLLTSIGFITNQILMSKLPYDSASFAPVTLVGTAPNVLFVHPSLPASTVNEVIAFGKANPGALLFASSGNATSPHLAAEFFASLTGIEMIHVPYRGTGPAIADLLAGHVNAYFDTMQSMQYVQDGRLKAIAVASDARLSRAPDLPTFVEAGMSNFKSSSWFGLFVQERTPAPIRQQIYQDVREVLETPEIREKISQIGVEPTLMDPAQFSGFLRGEFGKWETVIQARNIRLERE
jgi:tripartite-type tricarboxylate transporter receptor subunit TctC